MARSRMVFAALVLVACTKASPRGGVESGTVPSADGVPISYEVRGQGATTLVFIHGWSCDRNYWRHQVDSMQGEYRVIALDLAGHGASGKDRTDWSTPNFANDVAAVIRATDAKNVVLIGVIGVEAFYDVWAGRQYLRRHGCRSARDRVTRIGQPAGMGGRPPGDGGSALQAPAGLILVTGGGAGTAKFQRARKGRADLGVQEVPGAGHFLMLEVPSAFNSRLREMLKALPPGSGIG